MVNGFTISRYKSTLSLLAVIVVMCLVTDYSPANAGVLFYDGFEGTANDVDRTKWTSPVGDAATFGRTTIRNPLSIPHEGLPTTVNVVNGVAQLRLDTYNPTSSPTTRNFWGSELDTIDTWNPAADVGIRFETRARIDDNQPGGLVSSVFGFGLTGNGVNNKDEIDFEVLSNQPDAVQINRFQDEPAVSGGTPSLLLTTVDLTEFNTFRIDWYQNNIDWYLNDVLFASAVDTIPTHPMGLRMNIWAPDMFFSEAFDSSLLPVNSLGDNQTYYYMIDWAKVSSIAVNPSSTVPEPTSVFIFGAGFIGLWVQRRQKNSKQRTMPAAGTT